MSKFGTSRGYPDYDEFKTGLTYSDILSMLWSDNPDPSTWKYKTKGVVLGLWHQIKLEMYNAYNQDSNLR